MCLFCEGVSGWEDEIGRVKVQVIIEVEFFYVWEYYLVIGESYYCRFQQGGGDGVRGNCIVFILLLFLCVQQCSGDQGIVIGGVVFIGDRVWCYWVIVLVK